MTPESEPFLGITLGWVLILLLWLPLSLWILRRASQQFKPGALKWAVVVSLGLVLTAIPVADDAYIQWHFNRLCRDAGIRFEKKLEVEGFYDHESPSGFEMIERGGYRQMEHRRLPDFKLERVEIVNGHWIRTHIDQPTLRYHRKYLIRHRTVGFRIAENEEVIWDSRSNSVVARKTLYTRYPGWVDSVWLRYFDNPGKDCPNPGQVGDLINTVFVPISMR